MSLLLYVTDDCESCQNALNVIEKNHIDVEIIHVLNSPERVPVNLFIVPALFQDEKLMAYGADIPTFLLRFKAG